MADHKNVIINDTAGKIDEQKQVLGDIEDLYAKDRELELEWLKEDYNDMGIQIN
jgi:hypothetical protein